MARTMSQQQCVGQQTGGQQKCKTSELFQHLTELLTLLLVPTIKYSEYIRKWEELVGLDALDPKLYSKFIQFINALGTGLMSSQGMHRNQAKEMVTTLAFCPVSRIGARTVAIGQASSSRFDRRKHRSSRRIQMTFYIQI